MRSEYSGSTGSTFLDSQQALREATELRISYVINGYGGIHSIAYAKKVHELLSAADKRGGKQAVIEALKMMREALEQGESFW